MKQVLALFALSGLAACSTVADGGLAGGPEADPAVFMRGYTEAWNRHAAGEIAASYYDMGQSVEDQTTALEATFEQMRAQGYDKSDIHEIEACITGEDEAWSGMKFTRLKTDGEPLGPPLRASEYRLAWDDVRGWRIKSIGGRDVDAPLECPAG